MSVRRGLVARHTSHTVLSAATRVAFSQHVAALIANGEREEALQLWSSVFEVVHMPWPSNEVLDVPGLPAMRTVVCTQANCARCLSGRSGFVFPFIGAWCRRRVIVAQGLAPSAAWEALESSNVLMDSMLVEAYSSGWELADFIPPLWGAVLDRAAAAPGCASLETVRRTWRWWQLGSTTWTDPGNPAPPGRADGRVNTHRAAHRSMAGWMAFVAEGSEGYLPLPCQMCGGLTRHMCLCCGRGLCQDCDLEAPDFFCCAEFAANGYRRIALPVVGPGLLDLDWDGAVPQLGGGTGGT